VVEIRRGNIEVGVTAEGMNCEVRKGELERGDRY